MASKNTLEEFNEIYHNTYESILEYVICNCSNVSDVEDIIQNIYYDLYKVVKKNKTEINDSYILGIAKHKVKDYYRFKYRQREVSFVDEEENEDYINNIPSEDDIENEIIKTDNINIIWDFLKSKKIVISQIFYLYYKLDYPIKEIAEKLNLSVSNTKHYLYRTLKELNKYVESEVREDERK